MTKLDPIPMFLVAVALLAGGCDRPRGVDGVRLPLGVHPGDVLTQRNDSGRTGQTTLAGLNPSSFDGAHSWGRLSSLPVDGAIYAQPLFALAQPTASGTRNVLYVATALNHVYAYDADNFQPVWDHKFGGPDTTDDEPPLRTARDASPCANMSPVYVGPSNPDIPSDPNHTGRVLGMGIQSTPVIDRAADNGAGRLYVAYRTRVGTTPVQHVAALSLVDGRVIHDQALLDSDLDGQLPGLRQRSSLLLSENVLYVAFASHCEERADLKFRGQLLAFDPSTLSIVGKWVTVPSSIYGGGIWQASTGIAADAQGRLFFITGNSMSNITGNDADNSPGNDGFANSIVRLVPQRSASGHIDFTPTSFQPYSAYWQNRADLDFGSAGLLVVPGQNVLVGGGKEGLLYVLDSNNLGGVDSNYWRPGGSGLQAPPACLLDSAPPAWCDASCSVADVAGRDAVKQKLAIHNFDCATPNMRDVLQWPHVHGSPSYARLASGAEYVYVWPEKDRLRAFARDTSAGNDYRLLPNAAIAEVVAPHQGMPGGMLSVNADPQFGGGVVFASVPTEENWPRSDGGVLIAFDATPSPDGKLHQLWNNYDDAYLFAKFVPPTVANGRVYLATFSNEVLVYGQGSSDRPRTPLGPRTHVAAAEQNAASHQVTAMTVDANGNLLAYWEANDLPWLPTQVRALNASGPRFPPGAPVTLAFQTETTSTRQLDAFVVGADGAVYVLWETNDSTWFGPQAITPTGLAPPGAKVATIKQAADQLDAFVVGTDGKMHVLWESTATNSIWQNGVLPGATTFAHGGPRNDCSLAPCASPATGMQHSSSAGDPEQIDLVAVDDQGILRVFALALAGSPTWSQPFDVLGVGVRKYAPDADIATIDQGAHQLDAILVDAQGALEVVWVVGKGNWAWGTMTNAGFAPPSASVAALADPLGRLDAAVVGYDGTLNVFYWPGPAAANGVAAWNGVAFTADWRAGKLWGGTSSVGVALPGASVALTKQSDGQIDAFVVGPHDITVSWFTNGPSWSRPARVL
jgi:hypothetical protein